MDRPRDVGDGAFLLLDLACRFLHEQHCHHVPGTGGQGHDADVVGRPADGAFLVGHSWIQQRMAGPGWKTGVLILGILGTLWAWIIGYAWMVIPFFVFLPSV